jgi:hypothetical protein
MRLSDGEIREWGSTGAEEVGGQGAGGRGEKSSPLPPSPCSLASPALRVRQFPISAEAKMGTGLTSCLFNSTIDGTRTDTLLIKAKLLLDKFFYQ